jgi:hypothetical protein
VITCVEIIVGFETFKEITVMHVYLVTFEVIVAMIVN